MPTPRKAGPARNDRAADRASFTPSGELDLLSRLRACPATLTYAEAGRLLNKDRSTIGRAVQKKKIPALQVGIGELVIDTRLWIKQIELVNPHAVFIRANHARKVAQAA